MVVKTTIESSLSRQTLAFLFRCELNLSTFPSFRSCTSAFKLRFYIGSGSFLFDYFVSLWFMRAGSQLILLGLVHAASEFILLGSMQAASEFVLLWILSATCELV